MGQAPMLSTAEILTARLGAALATFGSPYESWDPQVRAATRPEFGHLQSNLPLRLAGPTGLGPQEAGARMLAALDVRDLCLPPTVQGAGFLNFTLRPDYLAARVTAMLADDRLGAAQVTPPQRVVVDFSSPNVAKEMHVGHLRSTVIGDALARALAYVGHDVVRQNHLGDWGTQFGMLIEHLADAGVHPGELDLPALAVLYRGSRARFETEPAFAERSRQRVVALQAGDADTFAAWLLLVGVSLEAFRRMYARMGVLLTDADVAGESSYNGALAGVVADLAAAGLLVGSDGALCAFLPEFQGRDGQALPLIVRKRDGGFGYAATDLAALRHRVDTLGADRIVYVVDARQGLHFAQVFAVARAAGWLPDEVSAEHVAFGTVLGPDNKPFRTRSGETVTLSALLDEAESKAAALLDERGSDLVGAERTALARAVGIGAVKYADLSNALGRDYVFAVDRMVALVGDTGPYLQYAHARLVSLLAKAGEAPGKVTALDHPAEQRLAERLTAFGPAVGQVAATLEPHHLCTYLYELATALSAFYENCPVLSSTGGVRGSRLALCRATWQVLAAGLELLGLEAPDRM